MKLKLSVLCFLLARCICLAQDFTVNTASVDITVHREGYFDVIEKYDLEFETQKHGIYRTIQTRYDLVNDQGKEEDRKIRISHIRVPGYKFDAPFDFVQKLSDQIEIKIGDKNITLIGPQHYEIRYRVHNAFLFGEDYVRFYWNIKPDGWAAPFHKINFRIHVPEDIELNAGNCFVYSGVQGNSKPSEDFKLGFSKGVLTGLSREGFTSRQGESVTVLINLPVDSILEEKPFWPFWDSYGWVFIVATLLGGFIAVWYRFGKDDRVVSTTSYYPPGKIDPSMAGFLMDDKSDTADLIALIPYWGANGYLKIEEIGKKGWFGKGDTRLIRLKPLPADSPDYAREMFSGLFESATAKPAASGHPEGEGTTENQPEVLVSSLKNSFYTTMNAAKRMLKEQAQPYYVAESRKVKYIMVAVILVVGILGTLAGLFNWGLLAAFAIAITSVVLLRLNFYMVKRNAIGNQVLSELKGFKRFIKVAEEHKLKMLLEDDPGYFENTMGYALAFGLFEKWATKFNALNVRPPEWYHSAGTGQLSMRHFSKSFSSTMSGVSRNMVSSPSSSGSSGGGSSGGGFGGGGGGSW